MRKFPYVLYKERTSNKGISLTPDPSQEQATRLCIEVGEFDHWKIFTCSPSVGWRFPVSFDS